MLKFKKLRQTDFKKISEYTLNSPYQLCDYSLGVMITWDSSFRYKISEYNQTLIVMIHYGKEVWFLLPMGKDFFGALDKIEEYAVLNELPLKFTCVPDDMLKVLLDRYNGEVVVGNDRKWSDYIYLASEIKTFSGKKFSGQRNHINKFTKTYKGYTFKPISTINKGKLNKFLAEYKNQHSDMKGVEVKEFNNTLKLIKHAKKYNFIGGYTLYKGKIISFTVGEYMGKTLIIHIEKGLREYSGVYPTTFNNFVNFADNGNVEFINREDDSGDIGLRTSKLQYKPITLATKNYVYINSPMGKIKRPVLKGERVILNKITKNDISNYYKLCVNGQNNKYWGYNYKKDIKTVSKDSFYNLQEKDFKNKLNMSLAIRLKNSSELIGEVVLYNFDYNGRVETGVRLFKKYQNKGLASESLRLAINYIKTVLNKQPVAKCRVENASSYNMLTAVGYKEISRNDKFIYFDMKN